MPKIIQKEIISERLSQIIKTLGINKNRLALELNYKNSVVGNVVIQVNISRTENISQDLQDLQEHC